MPTLQTKFFSEINLDLIQDLDEQIKHYELEDLKQQLDKSNQVIVVHQMAKVGSTSVCESLKKAMPGVPIFHTHFLTSDELVSRIKKQHRLKRRPQIHLIESLILLKDLQKNDKEIKVITLIRDPIARNVSGFFQSIDMHFDNFYSRFNSKQISTEELIEVFLKKFPHKIPLNWLDREIKQVFGIDVYQIPFEPHKGYEIYQSDREIDLLLIRLKDLNRTYNSAFNNFLGLDNFVLESKNIGGNKKYSDIYDNFKKQICFPSDYLNIMYSSKFTKHFYSKEEIDEFKNKWLKR